MKNIIKITTAAVVVAGSAWALYLKYGKNTPAVTTPVTPSKPTKEITELREVRKQMSEVSHPDMATNAVFAMYQKIFDDRVKTNAAVDVLLHYPENLRMSVTEIGLYPEELLEALRIDGNYPSTLMAEVDDKPMLHLIYPKNTAMDANGGLVAILTLDGDCYVMGYVGVNAFRATGPCFRDQSTMEYLAALLSTIVN